MLYLQYSIQLVFSPACLRVPLCISKSHRHHGKRGLEVHWKRKEGSSYHRPTLPSSSCCASAFFHRLWVWFFTMAFGKTALCCGIIGVSDWHSILVLWDFKSSHIILTKTLQWLIAKQPIVCLLFYNWNGLWGVLFADRGISCHPYFHKIRG